LSAGGWQENQVPLAGALDPPFGIQLAKFKELAVGQLLQDWPETQDNSSGSPCSEFAAHQVPTRQPAAGEPSTFVGLAQGLALPQLPAPFFIFAEAFHLTA
jgi:hypothetical protein